MKKRNVLLTTLFSLLIIVGFGACRHGYHRGGFDEFDLLKKRIEYGYGRYPNVVSSLELERMLSATGPFGGMVLRPSDGEVVQKIAFIQCVGSRDRSIGNPYCSSVCCMFAIKEAVIAQEHNPGLGATIFFMDMRAFGKEFDDYYVASRGSNSPPGELRGGISAGIFTGFESHYYVELRLR